MAAGDGSDEPAEKGQTFRSPSPPDQQQPSSTRDESEDEGEEDENEEDEDDEEEEPRLKYANLTRNLKSLYRNGDATSAFFVAGDKMVSPCTYFPIPRSRFLTFDE